MQKIKPLPKRNFLKGGFDFVVGYNSLLILFIISFVVVCIVHNGVYFGFYITFIEISVWNVSKECD